MVFNATFNNNGIGLGFLKASFNNNVLGLWFLTPLSTIMVVVFNATFNNNG